MILCLYRKGEMMRIKILLAFVCISIIMVLSGCGTKTTSESILQEDLCNSDKFSVFTEDSGLEITDFEVIKRQTDEKEKTDIAWVKVNVESESSKGEMYFVMTYKLYNDGWMLEEVAEDETESWYFEPLCGVTDEEIMDCIPEGAEILDNSVNLEEGVHSIEYTYVEPHRYCNVTYTNQLMFTFASGYVDSDEYGVGSWNFMDSYTLEKKEDWDICGTYEDGDGNIITIEKFDTDGIFNYTPGMKWGDDSVKDRFKLKAYDHRQGKEREYSCEMVNIENADERAFFADFFFGHTVKIGVEGGYRFVAQNFNLWDLKIVSYSPRLFFGYDHIYTDFETTRSDGNRTIYIKLTKDLSEFTQIS